MEVNEQNLNTLGQVLTKTQSINLNERKQAELFLQESEKKAGFPILLLSFINNEQIPIPLRQSASITFKNLIKYQWMTEDGNSIINGEDKNKIKTLIVDLMLSSPKLVQKQLSGALTVISNHDFPDKWDNLVGVLVSKMQTNDMNKVIGALKSANSIFKRYRAFSASEKIMIELKNILLHFQEPMLKIFSSVTEMITKTSNGKELEVLFTLINLLLKIFYSLNVVDLPEYFEDHMKEYFGAFIVFLKYKTEAKELVSDDDEKAGRLHKVQANICEICNLYATKYEEEFGPFLQGFVQEVWTMLAQASNLPKFDGVVTSSIKFLTSIASGVSHQMFNNQNALQSICEKILIPAMTLRKSDQEVFEDNPFEYIRSDIEGSDTDTRRRSAVELVKGLRKHYEKEVTQIFTTYINQMLQQYGENKKKNWRAKDVAIYLVSALTVKSSLAEKGTTSINNLVPIEQFFQTQIITELNSSDSHYIIQADALKFLVTFRLQIPSMNFVEILPLVIKLLSSEYVVVNTYAANCIEKFLTVKDRSDQGYKNRLDKSAMQQFLPTLLTSLFNIVKKDTSTTPNHYVMKTIMRTIIRSQEGIMNYAPNLLAQLSGILLDVCKNPTNPTYNHYLFESISCLLNNTGKISPNIISAFEEKLFPIFSVILNQDITDFTPYAFQLLGQLISFRQDISQVYWGLLPTLLKIELWDVPGNRPSLVNLLQMYLTKGTQKIVSEKDNQGSSWMGILGVWQKLNSTRANDHNGFELLETIVQFVPPNAWQSTLPIIYNLIFTRLTQNKTSKYVKCFVLFLSTFINKHGASIVLNSVDSIKDGIFENVLTNWFNELNRFGGVDKKRMLVALSKLICECPEMLKKYEKKWNEGFYHILTLLGTPEEVSNDEDTLENVDNNDYTNVHAQLINSIKNVDDPLPNVDPKVFFVTSLHNLSLKMPGQLNPRISNFLKQEDFNRLGEYFAFAKISQPYIA
eukprot:TRINITY_DN2578_c0_g1_i1.p1 TRINITY_DN2578_c0_g1~~TRINITY_DN2578_c0_g1_i1.p1  ORF type:complete len:972 (-),score=302.01 TRINITY_DN2578_c0_g1_i1:116-3031(-)